VLLGRGDTPHPTVETKYEEKESREKQTKKTAEEKIDSTTMTAGREGGEK
jgi:hypothetical protein